MDIKEKKKEYDKLYRSKNMDSYKSYQKEYGKKYRKLNKDKLNKKNREYYENNKDRLKKNNNEWRKNNREILKITTRIYIENNKDEINRKARLRYHKNKHKKTQEQKNREAKRVKEYRLKTKKQKKEYDRKYKLNNRFSVYKRASSYRKNRRKNDVSFRIRCNLTKSLCTTIKTNKKTGRTIELLGCSIDELKKYLELLFVDGMTFENYGEWHIDHKIPCSIFDLSKEEAQRFCFHYSNLQPMWGDENIIKSNKISIEVLKKLDINLLKEKYKNLLAA